MNLIFKTVLWICFKTDRLFGRILLKGSVLEECSMAYLCQSPWAFANSVMSVKDVTSLVTKCHIEKCPKFIKLHAHDYGEVKAALNYTVYNLIHGLNVLFHIYCSG